MAPVKTLILHIGSHKTATTFIQGSLRKNAERLERDGLLYPRTGAIWQAHFKLCWALREMQNDPARAGGDALELPIWQTLVDEIKASPADTALVSAEEFSFLIDPHRLAGLRDHFDVRIIHYIRSPDSFVESFYNQVVKDFGTRETRTIGTYVAEEPLLFLNPRRTLEPWIEVFGHAAVTVRRFAPGALQGSPLADLFHAMGRALPDGLAPPDTDILQKVSLPPDALEYLRLSNRWLEREEGHYDFVVRLAQLAATRPNALSTTRAGLLSLAMRRNLRLRFAGQYIWLARTFFDSDRNVFPVDEAPPPPEDYDARPETADAATMGRVAALIHNAAAPGDAALRAVA